MAQVFDRGGKWYARFMHEGRDYCRSTGVVVATRSKKAAHESKAMAEAQLARMLAEVRGRESVDALFARLTEALDRLPQIEHEPKRIMLSEQLRKSVAARLPVADAWEAWLHSPRKRMPSAVTLDGYYAYWGRDEIKKHGRQSQHGFKNWLATQHQEVTFLDEITPGIAEEYATHLWRSGIAPRTYNGVIKFLRGMFKVLRSRAGLVTNVWEDIPAQDNNTEGRRNLTPQELAKVCSKAEGDLRYWLAIGLYTGLRLGDVVTLRWAELDFSAHVIRRIPNKTKRKGKVITFPLHPVLEAMLRELREATDPDQAVYLFPKDASRHQNGQSSALTGRIQNHFIKCGIDTHREGTGGRIKRDEEGKPIRDDKGAVEILQSRKRASVEVGFHSLRHSFVSLCAANRVPQVAIQELVGHGSPAMTALYSHAGDEQKADAIAALPVVSFYHEEKEK